VEQGGFQGKDQGQASGRGLGQGQSQGARRAHGLKTTSVNLYSPVCRAASTRKKDRCHPYGCAQMGRSGGGTHACCSNS